MGEADPGSISLKLLVDRNGNRVIFGEAGKDFVDFLFYFLTLPVGKVVKLLSKDKMVGSLGNIYESMESMHTKYMQPDLNKDHVLNPKVYSSIEGDTPFMLGNQRNADQLTDTKYLYRCSSGCAYASDKQAKCTNCGRSMNSQMTYVKSQEKKDEAAKIGKGGYVKDLLTYMVMDNLVVKPMSNISCITLLSTCDAKDLGALETVEVYIGQNEAVDLLKASFVTNNVLTSLFLGNQNA